MELGGTNSQFNILIALKLFIYKFLSYKLDYSSKCKFLRVNSAKLVQFYIDYINNFKSYSLLL